MHSTALISCCFEEVVALFVCEEFADVANGLPHQVICPGGGFSDQCLEFGKFHFDGVQVGAVWRRKKEPCTNVAQGLCRAGCLTAEQNPATGGPRPSPQLCSAVRSPPGLRRSFLSASIMRIVENRPCGSGDDSVFMRRTCWQVLGTPDRQGPRWRYRMIPTA